jgi:DNA-binding NarL/FixJ family response regulator
VLRKLRNTRPDLKAIVLLDSSKRENVLQAFQAGARGLFCRSQPVKMLCKCISVVSDGQVWANTEELGFLLEALAAAPSLPAGNSERLRTLSERERDVVACLAEGLSNRDIAMRLTISQHTVKNYMFRIFEKLGVSSRLELLFLVLSRTDHGQDVANQHPSTLQSAPKSASYSEKKVLAITSSSAGERKAVEAPSAPRQLVTELGSA